MSDPTIPPPDSPTEPVLTAGTITALVTAVLALIATLGLPISDDAQAAILGVIAALAPIVAAVWARRTAWSPASVRRIVLRNTPLPTTADKNVRDL